MLTKEQLGEIRTRAEAATPGPWERSDDKVTTWDQRNLAGGDGTAEDLSFIAHGRTDVPTLLDEIERLHGEVERARAEGQTEERRACANACRDEIEESDDAAECSGAYACLRRIEERGGS